MSLAIASVLLLASCCQLALGRDLSSHREPAREARIEAIAAVGRITFTGAVVVATVAAPLTAAEGDADASASGRVSSFPARVMVKRMLSVGEIVPQLRLLERAGEHFGRPQEMVVTYL